ncbi:MAG: 50S ribosomal protein L24 [Crocinitomicaceae bacterium]|nr:50S ribosomal protein L24 [Crocinitomicaceae bacterium]|tara:strand:+ start:970 stop:1293 length:324 start_codon:yes stop_codon:yes gene_type:complete
MQKKLKIKKGDTVKVIAGAALGQEGVILDVDYKKERVFVEGLSVVNKKHVKPQSDKSNPDGGIVDKDRSIHVSNVMLVHNGETTKVGRKIGENNKLVRFAKKTGEEI